METKQVANRLIPSISRSRFTRASTGAKKLAPVNMRQQEHQFVIDGYLVDEVLNQIPPTLKIIQAKVMLIKRGLERRLAVPNVLKKYGVVRMMHNGAIDRAVMVFDATNKTHIKQNVKEVCKSLDMPFDKAYFGYILLANADGSCLFEHCTKEIRPDETDQRKKLRVLGATTGVDRVQSVIAELGAKKLYCRIKEESVKMIMCTRE